MDVVAGTTLLGITGMVVTASVVLLLPISRRLGALLEAMTQEKVQRRAQAPELGQVRDLLSNIDQRLSLMEERQDFAEALIAHGEPKLLSVQPSAPRDPN